MVELERKIYESVPGKQVTMAHVISRPDKRVIEKLGFKDRDFSAIGIMTVTPGEAAIIAVDKAKKSGEVEIGFVDRFSGSVVVLGDVAAVKNSIQSASEYLQSSLGFSTAKLTMT